MIARSTRTFAVALALAAMPLSGCSCHHTAPNEIGVLTYKTGFVGISRGVQPDIKQPGATYFVPAFITDWHTYDRSLQNLVMVRDQGTGDRNGEDDIFFKTLDGNDIRVDVTVVWQINENQAPYLLENVGDDTDTVKERLVRPICRSVVRDVLNQLQSEEFYVSDKRFAKAAEAEEKLNEILKPQGVIVSQVIVGEYHFNPAYEEVIRDKKLAEQKTAGLRSQAKAAAEQSKRNLQQAIGQVNQQLATAKGGLETIELQADAQLFQNQQRAKAIVIERAAEAEAIKKQNEALASSGGKTMVKLRIAEALQGKPLIFRSVGEGRRGHPEARREPAHRGHRGAGELGASVGWRQQRAVGHGAAARERGRPGRARSGDVRRVGTAADARAVPRAREAASRAALGLEGDADVAPRREPRGPRVVRDVRHGRAVPRRDRRGRGRGQRVRGGAAARQEVRERVVRAARIATAR